MRANNLAVIVPVDTGCDSNAIRETVWSKTVELLTPQLGKMYTRFEPSPSAWNQRLDKPYGVLLGKEDPALFLYFYASAKARQAQSIHYHTKQVMDKAQPLGKSETEDAAVYSMLINGGDEETMAHLSWHLGMMEGRLFPDSALYFLQQKESFASDLLEKEVLGHMQSYALCLVTLAMETQNEA